MSKGGAPAGRAPKKASEGTGWNTRRFVRMRLPVEAEGGIDRGPLGDLHREEGLALGDPDLEIARARIRAARALIRRLLWVPGNARLLAGRATRGRSAIPRSARRAGARKPAGRAPGAAGLPLIPPGVPWVTPGTGDRVIRTEPARQV